VRQSRNGVFAFHKRDRERMQVSERIGQRSRENEVQRSE